MQRIKNHIILLLTLLLLIVGGLSNGAWAQSYHDGVWYSLYDDENYGVEWAMASDKTIHNYTGIFLPIAGNVFFDAKLVGNDKSGTKKNNSTDPQSYGVNNPFTLKVGGKNISVPLNVNATMHSDEVRAFGALLWTNYYYTYSYDYARGQVVTDFAENTSSISFVAPKNGTNNNHSVLIEYIKVPMANHILLSGETYGVRSVDKSFGEVIWGTNSASQTVNFRSFLTNGNITVKLKTGNKKVWRLGSTDNVSGEITSSKDGYTYKVGANKFAYNGSSACNPSNASVKGKASGYDFVIYFHPEAAVDYTGQIEITDGTSTAVVNLSGTGIKRNQTIIWNTDDIVIYTTDTLVFDAYARDETSKGASGVSIVYTPKSGTPAYMKEDTLKVVESGERIDDLQYNGLKIIQNKNFRRHVNRLRSDSYLQSGKFVRINVRDY